MIDCPNFAATRCLNSRSGTSSFECRPTNVLVTVNFQPDPRKLICILLAEKVQLSLLSVTVKVTNKSDYSTSQVMERCRIRTSLDGARAVSASVLTQREGPEA